MSRYNRYDDKALEVLRVARCLAARENRTVCAPDDLLAGCLLATSEVKDILSQNKLVLHEENVNLLQQKVTAAPAEPTCEQQNPAAKLELASDLRTILDRAESLSREQGTAKVTPLHLLHAGWPFLKAGLSRYVTAAGKDADLDKVVLPPFPPPTAAPQAPAAAPDREETVRTERASLPVLSELGRELTALPDLHPVIGREREINDLLAILVSLKPNALLLGDPGVGKTAIVSGLAQRIRGGDVPPQLRNCRIFELQASSLAAGTAIHGSFEKRLQDMVKELESNPNVIVFLDEFHTLNQPFRSTNPADALKPALARGRFRCIGATTPAEHYRHLQTDPALVRRFQTVHVPEPDEAVTLEILKGVAPQLGTHYGIALPEPLLQHAVELGREFVSQRRFPDKALDIVNQACAAAVLRGASSLTARDLDAAAGRIVGIPLKDGASGLADRLSRLEQELAARVLGQPEAVQAVAKTLQLCKRRLDLRPERPDGVFLFLGPTGVGKTALAEALAECLCGGRENLVRIDMSEFTEAHKVARLIGSPPGYVGYGDEPELVRAAQRHPNGVLLLDEFEKAHPDVQRLFLPVFDTGRVTDARGETVSLSNMTIILTSNIPVAGAVRVPMGFGGVSGAQPDAASGAGTAPAHTLTDPRLVESLKKHLPVELINRIDVVVPFSPVSPDLARRILHERVLTQANANLRKRLGLELVLDENAAAAVLAAGYSPEFGVRHLQRTFEGLVLLPLATDTAAAGSAGPGATCRALVVRADDHGSLRFEASPAPDAPTHVPETRPAGQERPGRRVSTRGRRGSKRSATGTTARGDCCPDVPAETALPQEENRT